MTRKEKRAHEARTLRHLVLHEHKLAGCDACERGRIRKESVCVSKGRQIDPDIEEQIQRPTAYGQLVQADNVIASPKHEGTEGARTTLHIRDHYSGVLSQYAAKRRTSENNLKAMTHFGGIKIHGAKVACKSDDASEVRDAANHLDWISFSSVPRDWPHNSHCERDIGITKDISGAIFIRSGCPDKCWPSVLECAAQARSFFTEAPVYSYEKGTSHEEEKKNKTRYEVALGYPFAGIEYPFGALIYYKKKAAVPGGTKSVPGYFAGWKLEPGLMWRVVVKVFDQEDIRLGRPNAFFPIRVRQAEVIIPKVADITFPLYNARQKAIANGKDFCGEIKEIESPTIDPLTPDEGASATAPSSEAPIAGQGDEPGSASDATKV